MIIIIADSIKNKVEALSHFNLEDELYFHKFHYGCEPKKIYIYPFLEGMNSKPQANKNNMILLL